MTARRPLRKAERAAIADLPLRPAFEIEKYAVCLAPNPRKKCSIGSSIEPSKSKARDTCDASRIASQ